jgi:ABC-type lipoprotein release transport system permease subunit
VGFTYDATKLQDKTYMLIFVLIVALAILAVTVSTILE